MEYGTPISPTQGTEEAHFQLLLRHHTDSIGLPGGSKTKQLDQDWSQ